jgi:RNA polymerase sigma-70 factor, ECF subfamily
MKNDFWQEIQQLAAQSQDGDQVSYEDFLNRIYAYLKRKIRYSIPLNAQDDVIQETLLAIHSSFKTLDRKKSPKSWINAIAHYKICDFLRNHYSKFSHEREIQDELIFEDIDKVEEKELIENLLSRLNETERLVILSLKYQGQTLSELSKNIGKTEANLKVICFRALAKMRQLLLEEELYENG